MSLFDDYAAEEIDIFMLSKGFPTPPQTLCLYARATRAATGRKASP